LQIIILDYDVDPPEVVGLVVAVLSIHVYNRFCPLCGEISSFVLAKTRIGLLNKALETQARTQISSGEARVN